METTLAKTIGTRFRSARALVPNLNRKSFCEKHNINKYTMQSWENGLHVSKGKNVVKFIEALALEGISCTSDWLIDGVGEPARVFEHNLTKPAHALISSNILEIINNFYEDLRVKIISHVIQDDSMRPVFSKNNLVIGKEVTGDLLPIHQKYCLIELSPERVLVRKAIIHLDTVILVAEDQQMPTLTLGSRAKIYQIIWQGFDV